MNDHLRRELDLRRRQNNVHAAYVNAALRIKMRLGPERAEKMLDELGVSPSVTARVLAGECKHR